MEIISQFPLQAKTFYCNKIHLKKNKQKSVQLQNIHCFILKRQYIPFLKRQQLIIYLFHYFPLSFFISIQIKAVWLSAYKEIPVVTCSLSDLLPYQFIERIKKHLYFFS